VSFALANGKVGKFHGMFDATHENIRGHWLQQVRVDSGIRFASPVSLAKSGPNQWRGLVTPADDVMTFYLMVQSKADGSVSAFLRNPERNLGRLRYRTSSIERDGDHVKLLAEPDDAGKRAVLAEGQFRGDPDTLTFYFDFGGSYDFTRVAPGEPSGFYPRGAPGATYRYAVPPQLDDGWPTASPEEVGLSTERLEAFVRRLIDTPIDSTTAQRITGSDRAARQAGARGVLPRREPRTPARQPLPGRASPRTCLERLCRRASRSVRPRTFTP
jgi:hypothetical protein